MPCAEEQAQWRKAQMIQGFRASAYPTPQPASNTASCDCLCFLSICSYCLPYILPDLTGTPEGCDTVLDKVPNKAWCLLLQ